MLRFPKIHENSKIWPLEIFAALILPLIFASSGLRTHTYSQSAFHSLQFLEIQTNSQKGVKIYSTQINYLI